jgi:hypothetical protein
VSDTRILLTHCIRAEACSLAIVHVRSPLNGSVRYSLEAIASIRIALLNRPQVTRVRRPANGTEYGRYLSDLSDLFLLTCQITMSTWQIFLLTCQIHVTMSTCQIFLLTYQITMSTCQIFLFPCQLFISTCQIFLMTYHLLMCLKIQYENVSASAPSLCHPVDFYLTSRHIWQIDIIWQVRGRNMPPYCIHIWVDGRPTLFYPLSTLSFYVITLNIRPLSSFTLFFKWKRLNIFYKKK